jgi:hypothetical protein
MAHFAKINENNVVEEIIVIDNKDCQNLDFPESEVIGQMFITSIGLDGTWKQTSYNSNFRKKYAGIGDTFDETRDAFITPKPFTSWVLNEETSIWEAPTPKPEDNKTYRWNEETLSWIEYVEE